MSMDTQQNFPEKGGLCHLMQAATALARLTAASTNQQQLNSSIPQENISTLNNNIVLTTTNMQNHHQVATMHTSVVSDEEDSNKLIQSNKPPTNNNESIIINNNNISNDTHSIASSTLKREIFPQRLMAILDDVTLCDVVSWLPHGRSFVIIRPDVFTESVLPKYLPPVDARSSTKYPSFTRKLNRWGFRQATRGPDTGAFHHPLFRRDKPQLCFDMVCQRSRDRRVSSSDASDKPTNKRRNHSKGPSSKATPTSSTTKLVTITKTQPTYSTNNTTQPTSVAKLFPIAPAKVPPSVQSSLPASAPQGEAVTNTNVPFACHPAQQEHVNHHEHAAVLAASMAAAASSVANVDVNGAAALVAVAAASANINLQHEQQQASYTRLFKSITTDVELLQWSLRQRDEYERLRLAKALLYESFLNATSATNTNIANSSTSNSNNINNSFANNLNNHRC